MVAVLPRLVLFSCLFSIAYGYFSFPNFYNTLTLKLTGPLKVNGKLMLAGGYTEETGSAWEKAYIDVRNPFTTSFTFSIVNNGGGGDGFAFVIQGASDVAIGQDGSGLGYAGIPNSIAFEFDTYQNIFDPNRPITNDPNNNHIGVHFLPGGVENRASEDATLFRMDNPGVVLNDGSTHTAKVVSVRNRFRSFDVQFYFNADLIGTLYNFTLSDQLVLSPPGFAWIGFTAATGGKKQDHFIHNWNFFVTDTTEACQPDFITTSCVPNTAGSDVSCASITDCQACTKAPFPCDWTNNCAYMNIRGGGVQSFLDCPSSSSSSKAWIWIVISCVCIVAATLGVLYYFRRKARQTAVNSGPGYTTVDDNTTSNYAQM